MGFFDRLAAKKSNPAKPSPAPAVPQDAAAPTAPTPALSPAAAAAQSVKTALLAARAKLDAKDLPAAMALYEELLANAGDRADVLVALSGDLGSCGYVEQIIELVAPRYDADRHGPATGLNLLQAYLATRNTDAAQHLLDILFALQQPELEARLHGFSNALGELIEAERRGQLPANAPVGTDGNPAQPKSINLVSISRPIWSYGLEALPQALPPAKTGRLRRIAFGQLALLGTTDFAEKTKLPEDDSGRFTRGFPLWLAETFYFSPHYAPIAAVGLFAKDHYAIFPAEWTPANIRQLVETAGEGLDYVFTGAIRQQADDVELILRVWEVKKFRERKQFTARWTPATADAELAKLHEQVRLFMEWQTHPAGPAYAPTAHPRAWCDTLGRSLAFFLADKQVLPREQVAAPAESLTVLAERAPASEADSLAYLTLRDRAQRLAFAEAADAPAASLADTPLVAAAREALGA